MGDFLNLFGFFQNLKNSSFQLQIILKVRKSWKIFDKIENKIQSHFNEFLFFFNFSDILGFFKNVNSLEKLVKNVIVFFKNSRNIHDRFSRL